MGTWEKLQSELEGLKTITDCKVFGKSTLGADLLSFSLGSGKCVLLVQGGIHAREYITSFLCIELAKYLACFRFEKRVVFVPLSNPDGVKICLKGASWIADKNRRGLIKNILRKSGRKRFKANANGVDLNVNFDCHWGEGKSNQNSAPDFANYIGRAPNSEVEVQSLIALTRKLSPKIVLSFHSKGRVFYYGFKGQDRKKLATQRAFVKLLARETGYKPLFTKRSAGGYKDYCIMKLNILGFTIEVGDNKIPHPIGTKNLHKIFREIKDIVLLFLKHMEINDAKLYGFCPKTSKNRS